MIIALVIIAVLVVACIGYIISTQRTLVSLDEFCSNALSQIGVQLKSRWDLIGSLVKMVEKYQKHEAGTLENVIAMRSGGTPKTAAEINQQESAITKALGAINVVFERYPELKADGVYRETMAKMEHYEENVRHSRMVYNDTVTRMNRMVRQFPSSFVASMLHFGIREYLKTDEKTEEYPEINV